MTAFPSPFFFRRIHQLWRFHRHWVHAQGGRDKSWAGEWKAIDRILSGLQIRKGIAVDIAASDGVAQSSTIELFKSGMWSGLAVEMDPVKFAKLAYLYAGFSCQLAKCRVTPENIVALLSAHEIPRDFEFLNLDIDSYDLYVMEAMLAGGYRPKVISMEINEAVPPPLFFAVQFDGTNFWQGDHFFGCSAVAAATVVKPFGYNLESIQYNNALFVRGDLAGGMFADVPVGKAYLDGYSTKPDRALNFPWNSDVDGALLMTAEQSLQYFKDKFRKYQGRYELRISGD